MEPKDCSAAQREFVFAKSARDQCRVEKLLKLERPVAERFYALYREQFNPDLTVPDAVVEEWISVGTFRAKEKITAKPQQVVDWTFAESGRR
jgi:hypothetical protein